MATRLHFVKKARKQILGRKGEILVDVGESYYWWQFAYSQRQISKERPRRSRLTRSEYEATIMDIQDDFDLSGCNVADEVKSTVEDVIEQISNLRDETSDKLDSMPEQLQESSILNERIETLDSAISDLEAIDLDFSGSYNNNGDEIVENSFDDWRDSITSDVESALSCL